MVCLCRWPALLSMGTHAFLDDARVVAQRDAEKGIDQHFALRHVLCKIGLELVGNRQKHQIRKADAVNGGDEGYRNAATKLTWIGKIFHHVDQAEYCTDDAD